MRFRRLLPLLLLACPPATARPPAAPSFARYDELMVLLAERRQELRRKEEFERKPRVWKMLILFRERRETFERTKLTGETVLEAVEKWDALKKPSEQLDEDAIGVLQEIPRAVAARFAPGGQFNKHERWKASKILVEWLTHDLRHFRVVAIDTLNAMYKTRLMYQPDMKPGQRRTIQREWEKYIKRKRR